MRRLTLGDGMRLILGLHVDIFASKRSKISCSNLDSYERPAGPINQRDVKSAELFALLPTMKTLIRVPKSLH